MGKQLVMSLVKVSLFRLMDKLLQLGHLVMMVIVDIFEYLVTKVELGIS